MEFVPAPQQAP